MRKQGMKTHSSYRMRNLILGYLAWLQPGTLSHDNLS